jgi:hypothetical protein
MVVYTLLRLVCAVQVESLLLKNSSQLPDQDLFAELAALVQVENSNSGSPVPVRCTKKLYTNLINHVDTVSP